MQCRGAHSTAALRHLTFVLPPSKRRPRIPTSHSNLDSNVEDGLVAHTCLPSRKPTVKVRNVTVTTQTHLLGLQPPNRREAHRCSQVWHYRSCQLGVSPHLIFFCSPALTTSSAWALIIPAKLHPEVVIQAVAARDRKRAEEFAKKNGIPEVKDSYQGKFSSSSLGSLLLPTRM